MTMTDKHPHWAELEAQHRTLMKVVGAHIQADAYRDTFPDNDQDAAFLRKQETWWRLTARSWLGGDLANACAQRAKDVVADTHRNAPGDTGLVSGVSADPTPPPVESN